MVKKFDNFLVDKKMTEFVATINEGWLANVWSKLWNSLKTALGSTKAFKQYTEWCIKKGYNKNSKGEFVKYYPFVPAGNTSVVDTELKNIETVEEPVVEEPIEEPVMEGLESPDVNIADVGMKELKSILAENYEMRLEDSREMFGTFIWGAPGIGKTQSLQQFCKSKGLDLMVWNLATCEPSDFIGVPDIEVIEDKAGVTSKRTANRPPIIFPPKDIKNGGILFLDEMNRANKFVLGAALTLCIEGRAGTYILPDTWQVIAAGNRAEDADVEEMDAALGNRFQHVNLFLTVTEWLKWASQQPDMYPGIVAFVESIKLDQSSPEPA